MTIVGANLQQVNYADAVHAFTYPKADVPGKMEYNEAICHWAFRQIAATLQDSLV